MNKTDLINAVAEASELSKKTLLKRLMLFSIQFLTHLKTVTKYN